MEAKELIIVTDGLALSLSEYQERFIPQIEKILETIQKERDDEERR